MSFSIISALILPALTVFVIVYALIKKVDVYAAFVAGAKRALPTLIRILPYVCAMTAALALFRKSGAMDALLGVLSPALTPLGVPKEVVPLFLLRPLSGSAALALLDDIFKSVGPDSFAGRVCSVLVGSSETLFYTVALYLGSVGVTRSRYIIPVSLFVECAGLFVVVGLCRIIF